MPAECHPGTDVEIPSGVPRSAFRVAIPNVKRYMKSNRWDLADVTKACTEGDVAQLEMLLATGDENNLFNGDLNEHLNSMTALQFAAQAGNAECVALLLKAKADVHMRESVSFGQDPDEGRTALDFAKECDWGDCMDLLESAEKEQKYGWYIAVGPTNNMKQYGVWEWGAKAPPKGWFLSRPGAARKQGLDPRKYGAEDFPEAEEDLFAGVSISAPALPSQPTLPIGLLFPGQGSQYVKMMMSVKDIPAVKDMLAKAEGILGFDVLKLCLEGPESKLEETEVCQPVMFIAGLAGIEKLRLEREEAVTRCQVLAGLSLGEYTALCAAGVFTFEDGLRLVRKRGEAMQAAAQSPKQAMISVAGLDKPKLVELCQQAASSEGGGICQIANELFPKGFSCAGTEAAVLKLKQLADEAGALQAKVLKTSGGFHTSLMAPAQDALGKMLDEVLPKMKTPRCSVYMNATSQPVKPGTPPSVIADLLKKQLTSPVLWEPSVRAMIKDGVSEFYEVGPMKQIKSMMKRIDSKVWGSTVNVEV